MDTIFQSWLESQYAEGMRLAAESDVLTLHAGPGSPPREYLARFASPTMVREQGEIVQRSGFDILIRFPPDYLRSAPDPARVVALLSPETAWHPNVAAPFLCIGAIAPGTSLREILFQIFEIMTYQRLTPTEANALNRDACSWARNHMERFPLAAAPLLRRGATFEVAEIPRGGAPL